MNDTKLDTGDVAGTFQKVAAYISTTQPVLDRYNAQAERFQKRAAQVSGVLVDRGIIPSNKSDLFLQKVAEDPTKALEMIVKLAHLVGPDDLGEQADGVKVAASNVSDPFDRLVLFGDASSTGDRFDGLVE